MLALALALALPSCTWLRFGGRDGSIEQQKRARMRRKPCGQVQRAQTEEASWVDQPQPTGHRLIS